jgi:hypothetical protein
VLPDHRQLEIVATQEGVQIAVRVRRPQLLVQLPQLADASAYLDIYF